MTVHVHGSEVEPESDGNPNSWFTPGFVLKGEGWRKQVYHYVNNQEATTLWYHDHALGITRLNVYMGLAGFYLIRDPLHEPVGLPAGPYEIPIVIQDRSFYTDGSLAYDEEGVNPLIHPFWVPEFFGNTIVVNGKVWPYLNVEPRKYRFRFLNGSNARFYNLKLPKRGSFIQIGTDGGYLASPVVLNELLLGPGERADVIIDFTGLPAGTEIIVRNDARSPFPGGEYPNPQTVGQIMKFVVIPLTAPDPSVIPSVLNTITQLSEATVTRTLTLNEVGEEESGEPLGGFLDGKMWDDSTTETPRIGTTEIWEIINLTGDAHPIHIHLAQTQLLNRQRFQTNRYLKLYNELNPIIPAPVTTNPPVDPYLIGSPVSPPANERGWKDTHKMFPGDVTRVIIRFAPQGQLNYPFDATAEPGYVWHCHILEHEDNEMMRPMKLLPPEIFLDKVSSDLRNYSLEQNYPNPFNPSTTVKYVIPRDGYVTLKVYDMLGREVAILVNEYEVAGFYLVKFDASKLSSGVYFYKISADSFIDMKKMVLIK
jgi:FtsP/CotA-like multicopper oxidase with cupredoxin domain